MKKFRMGDKFVAQIGLGYWGKAYFATNKGKIK